MPIPTLRVSKTSHGPVPQSYSSLAAATYLTWSAMIWTALLMEDQQALVAERPLQQSQQTIDQLQIGVYSIGENEDINLYGHPEIRY